MMAEGRSFEINVGQYGGGRLDVFLAARLSSAYGDLSRSFIQKLIDDGQILVNGVPRRPSYKVRAGDMISGRIPEPEPLKVEAERAALDVLYEDRDIIVINKPRGMTVHPGAGKSSGTLVNALLGHCEDLSGIGGVLRPGIVHRLDKDTSGVMVIAKNDMSHLELARQFKAREVKKVYIALVRGVVNPRSGVIDAPIGRHPVHRKKMTIISGGRGRSAITRYKTIEIFPEYSLLELHPETGRTHQIRVHLASIGHPIVGDPLYGGKTKDLDIQGQALHAMSLSFCHPRTHEPVRFEADLPDDMMALVSLLRERAGKEGSGSL